MPFDKIINKRSRFYFKDQTSPTHAQLIHFMVASGLKQTRWLWRADFSQNNLNFSNDVCESLEFKHLLALMAAQYFSELMPETYVLNEYNWPGVLSDLAHAYYMSQQKLLDQRDDLMWILKPALLNNGQHIKIFHKLSEIEEHLFRPHHLGGPHVLQRYILDPYLYQDRKFSLRYFVVLTQEAGAFLYPKGYLNVALKTYSAQDYNDLSAHLTNEHLFEQPAVVQIPTESVPQAKTWYPQIQSIVKTVTHCTEKLFQNAYQSQKDRSFAIFGFDFLVDQQEKVWLLEANHGPCFPVESHHPLQEVLYRPFWEAILQQFVVPIASGHPIPAKGVAGFESMRG